jgi:hypothetical protein
MKIALITVGLLATAVSQAPPAFARGGTLHLLVPWSSQHVKPDEGTQPACKEHGRHRSGSAEDIVAACSASANGMKGPCPGDHRSEGKPDEHCLHHLIRIHKHAPRSEIARQRRVADGILRECGHGMDRQHEGGHGREGIGSSPWNPQRSSSSVLTIFHVDWPGSCSSCSVFVGETVVC